MTLETMRVGFIVFIQSTTTLLKSQILNTKMLLVKNEIPFLVLSIFPIDLVKLAFNLTKNQYLYF